MEELNLSKTSYTAKDFQEAYPELLQLAKELSYKWDPTVSNESDPGVVLIKELAIAIDKINYNSDKNALENFPATVSQQRTARALFSLLGYFPKWYRSALSNVILTWIGEIPETTDVNQIITLPVFTQIRDVDGDYVYTLLDKPVLSKTGEPSKAYTAIEGYCKELSINGSTLINLDVLDDYNRIYLPDYAIAQNGIFISNVDTTGQPTMNWWTQVDNLYTNDLGLSIYSFGVDILSGQCYIEFPTDIASLIHNGLSIHYIISTGSQGNVTINSLTQFYNSTITAELTGSSNSTIEKLSSDNLEIRNTGLISTGKDPETIDECYNNYKKIVGTFDTLVTLRDYTNAIYNTELVSNGFVTDRTNDIQDSYKIITQTADLTNYVIVNTTKDPETSEVSIKPFDLKIYALNYNDIINTKADYDYTFKIYTDKDPTSLGSGLWNLVQVLNNNKCISHDFLPLESDKICLLKNKYTISCKIIPNTTTTDIQNTAIKQNIASAIYNKLNARNVDFGKEITYDQLMTIIKNADTRIKTVILDTPKFNTYAVYYQGNVASGEDHWKEICISDEHTDYISGYARDNSYGITFYSNYKKYPMISSFTSVGVTITRINPRSFENELTLHVTSYNDISTWYMKYDGSSWNLFDDDESTIPVSANINLAEFGIVISGSPSTNSKLTITLEHEREYTDPFESYLLNTNYTYLDLNTDNIYSYTGSQFVLYSAKRADFRKDIFAKCVLAGVTPYLKSDGPDYKYQINQTGSSYNDVQYITTDTQLVVNLAASPTEVKLNDNETIQFYRPYLLEGMTFGTYVKFEFVRPIDKTTIPANSDYVLRSDEIISFFYKEADEDEQYHVMRYGSGTIISPSYTLEEDSFVDVTRYPGRLTQSESSVLSIAQSESVASSNNLQTLTSSKQIVIKEKSEAILDSKIENIYFITNKTITDNNNISYYEMDFTGSHQISEGNVYAEYILKENEFFIYSNASKTSLEVLGSGTLVKIKRIDSGTQPIVKTVRAISSSQVAQYGVSVLEDLWLGVDGTQTPIIVSEQEFLNVLPKGTIDFITNVEIEDETNVTINKDGFNVDSDVIGHSIVPPAGQRVSFNLIDTTHTKNFVESLDGYNTGELDNSFSTTLTLVSSVVNVVIDTSSCVMGNYKFIDAGIGVGKNIFLTRTDFGGSSVAESLTFTFKYDSQGWKYTTDDPAVEGAEYVRITSITQFGLTPVDGHAVTVGDTISIVLTTADSEYLIWKFRNNYRIDTFIKNTDIQDYFTVVVSDTPSGESLQDKTTLIEFQYIPQGQVSLSAFTVNYTQPTGESGQLTKSTSNDFSWKCKAYVSVDTSSTRPEKIYGNQTVKAMIGGDVVTIFDIDSNEDDRYLCASEALYTAGGEGSAVKLVNSEGEVYLPSLYAYNINDIVSIDGANNDSATYDSVTGDITITLKQGNNQVYTEVPVSMPPGKYVIPVSHAIENITDLSMKLVNLDNGSKINVIVNGALDKSVTGIYNTYETAISSVTVKSTAYTSFTENVMLLDNNTVDTLVDSDTIVVTFIDSSSTQLTVAQFKATAKNYVYDSINFVPVFAVAVYGNITDIVNNFGGVTTNVAFLLSSKGRDNYPEYIRYYSDEVSGYTQLKEIDGVTTNFNAPGVHYVNMTMPDFVETTPRYMLQINVQRSAPLTSSVNIRIRNLMKYIINEVCNSIPGLKSMIDTLDTDGIFDYTYKPEAGKLIENPLSSINFFDRNHPYKNFTIAQLYTIDSSIVE